MNEYSAQSITVKGFVRTTASLFIELLSKAFGIRRTGHSFLGNYRRNKFVRCHIEGIIRHSDALGSQLIILHVRNLGPVALLDRNTLAGWSVYIHR